VVDCALQIARGLAAAHDRGIVLRDLKPDNIFITNDGRAKILDFGLAKLTRRETCVQDLTRTIQSEPGMVLGTIGYMSREQVRGKDTDARSDSDYGWSSRSANVRYSFATSGNSSVVWVRKIKFVTASGGFVDRGSPRHS